MECFHRVKHASNSNDLCVFLQCWWILEDLAAISSDAYSCRSGCHLHTTHLESVTETVTVTALVFIYKMMYIANFVFIGNLFQHIWELLFYTVQMCTL